MTHANPSATDIAELWARRFHAQHEYLSRVYATLITEGGHVLKTTTGCTECDTEILADDFETSAHWIMWDPQSQRHIVIIGCQGYWLVEPASLGMDNDNWSGIEGVNV